VNVIAPLLPGTPFYHGLFGVGPKSLRPASLETFSHRCLYRLKTIHTGKLSPEWQPDPRIVTEGVLWRS
jgi:hypothetical protein